MAYTTEKFKTKKISPIRYIGIKPAGVWFEGFEIKYPVLNTDVVVCSWFDFHDGEKSNIEGKKTINIICYITSFVCWVYVFCFFSCKPPGAKEYMYSGIIVDKGYEAPTSGYKSSREASYFLMMKEDSSGKTIRIKVTIPTWYSLDKGKRATFKLSNWDLYYSGNTTDMSKNLYEQ